MDIQFWRPGAMNQCDCGATLTPLRRPRTHATLSSIMVRWFATSIHSHYTCVWQLTCHRCPAVKAARRRQGIRSFSPPTLARSLCLMYFQEPWLQSLSAHYRQPVKRIAPNGRSILAASWRGQRAWLRGEVTRLSIILEHLTARLPGGICQTRT